eukprot:5205970-Amphidinium_carterae.1
MGDQRVRRPVAPIRATTAASAPPKERRPQPRSYSPSFHLVKASSRLVDNSIVLTVPLRLTAASLTLPLEGRSAGLEWLGTLANQG